MHSKRRRCGLPDAPVRFACGVPLAADDSSQSSRSADPPAASQASAPPVMWLSFVSVGLVACVIIPVHFILPGCVDRHWHTGTWI